MAFHDTFVGVAVVNTDVEYQAQSNFTVLLTNGLGFQVTTGFNALALDIMVPDKTFVSTQVVSINLCKVLR